MLRALFKTDLSQVLAIEESVHAVPWNEDAFKTCFQLGHMGWVFEQQQKILGFIMISLRIEECHILNLCVAREYQHQGYGRKLLEQALSYAKQQGAGIAYLEVRQSNSRAISLYRGEKFHLIGMRKDYYPTPGGRENALVFAKSLSQG